MRLTPAQRAASEQRIRAAAGQLLSGDIPPGGRCDVKTLARLARVDRAAFYGDRPYAPLREDFERRARAMKTAGEHPDPRDAQISRLTGQITILTARAASQDAIIAELSAFKAAALARLAAQHDEITRLRRAGPDGNVRRLPDPASRPAP
jgi:hypothetical protein